MIRVLVAEDSATVRDLLLAILGDDPEIEIVGTATNGREAVELTGTLRPDVVTMDIRMPGLDGFEATRQIMTETPTPIVIVSGHVDVREVRVSMKALELGAVALMPKPAGPAAPDFEASARRFVDTIKAMSAVKVVHRWRSIARMEPPARPAAEGSVAGAPGRGAQRARIVAIATSTGGPPALERILSALPGDFATPVLVVQHIGKGFASGLADWLDSVVTPEVKVAEPGERLRPGVVYVAPDDRHLGVADPSTIRLSNEPPIGTFKPSGTFLFDSVAKVFGPGTLAVILTGMGCDGVEGLRAVRQAGGYVVAQDEASSLVFGMPRQAIAAGLADSVLPLDAIAARLIERARQPRLPVAVGPRKERPPDRLTSRS